MLLLLCAAIAVLAGADAAKRNPTREQPHVVLESRSLNTFHAPAFHEDAFVAAPGVPHEYIVQLAAPIVDAKQRIESALGVKFSNYLPHNSYLLYVTEEMAHRVREQRGVLWVGAFLPEYKIASSITSEDAHIVLEHDLFRFALHYAGERPSAEMKALFETRAIEQAPVGVEITRFEAIESSTSTLLVEFAAHGNDHARRVAAYFAMQPEIHFIEPLGPMQYHNLEIAKIDLYDSTGSSPIRTLDGLGTVLGLMDQGINAGSCHFGGDKFVVQGGGASPDPHGTGVAAMAAGNSGVAPLAKLFFIAQQSSAPLTGLNAKLAAASQKSVFTVVSAGSATATSYNAGAREIDQYSNEFDRTLFVVSGGNNPNALSGAGYSKNALVVGSTNIGPKRATIGATSSRGGTKDYRYKPDVMSSGDGVSLMGCELLTLEGTSAAAATAAGAALLVRQYFLDGWWGTGTKSDQSSNIGFNPSAALVKAVLVHSATPVATAQLPSGGASGAGMPPTTVQGFGRIELRNALWFNGTSPFKRMSISDTIDLENNGQFRICINVNALRPMRATVAWSDVPADVVAGHTLVNDIDLVVYSQSTGQEWRGNNAIGFDHANTVERVAFTPPELGQYVVVVHGVRLLSKQKFGLIVTGDYSEVNCIDQQMSGQEFVPVYNFPKCPGGCGGLKNDCQNGVCSCAEGSVGVDCALTTCGDCGLHGECDFVIGGCRCVQGRRGDKCAFEYTSQPPEEIFVTQSESSYQGRSVGLFAGLFVLLYLIGCVFSAVCGVVCGTKYLEYKRDNSAA